MPYIRYWHERNKNKLCNVTHNIDSVNHRYLTDFRFNEKHTADVLFRYFCGRYCNPTLIVCADY